MAYTSANLASVQAAILALATGTRAVSVSLGDKTIEYSKVDLSKLEALRQIIYSELNSNANRCCLIRTEKGL